MRHSVLALFLLLLSTFGAHAQQNYWVQIEARPTLSAAQERARDYANRLNDINGFYLGGGFYGIAIGPFTEFEADTARANLLRSGQIPSDSFVTDGRRFQQQFWPIGGTSTQTQPRQIEPVTPVDPQAPDETLQEARASEARLTRAEREELQRALRWAGFYSAAIDGAFGRGTRASMENWQAANARVATGVLTTLQRADLLEQYNAVLTEAGMRMIRDEEAGIRLQMPTAVVSFAEYQPPLVRFDATDGSAAQVLLISQRGDAGKLRGLYEVLQSLDIVPVDGPRNLRNTSFEIEGADARIHTYATATVQDGEIKGFALVWPADDEQRRTRILEAIKDSFERVDGVLDPNLVPPSADQAINMVAGLAVRQPQFSQSGFYVSGTGHVVTAAATLQNCTRLTLDRDAEATLIASDPELGIAILNPVEAQTPVGIASFDLSIPRLQSSIAVAGFPFGGVLGAPTLTFGTLMDLRSLTGDARFKRLALTSAEGDAGGPIVNDAGAVVGMLQPRAEVNGRVLPADTSFAVKASEIGALLQSQNIAFTESNSGDAVSSVALARDTTALTVLVSCW